MVFILTRQQLSDLTSPSHETERKPLCVSRDSEPPLNLHSAPEKPVLRQSILHRDWHFGAGGSGGEARGQASGVNTRIGS